MLLSEASRGATLCTVITAQYIAKAEVKPWRCHVGWRDVDGTFQALCAKFRRRPDVVTKNSKFFFSRCAFAHHRLLPPEVRFATPKSVDQDPQCYCISLIFVAILICPHYPVIQSSQSCSIVCRREPRAEWNRKARRDMMSSTCPSLNIYRAVACVVLSAVYNPILINVMRDAIPGFQQCPMPTTYRDKHCSNTLPRSGRHLTSPSGVRYILQFDTFVSYSWVPRILQ